MIGTEQVHQSKWGWHPCNYEQFLELKEFHSLLLAEYRRFRHWRSWFYKQPQNRYPQEPKHCVNLVDCDHRTGRFCFARLRDGSRTCLYRHILAEYQNARRPMASVQDVRQLNLPQEWRIILQELRQEHDN